MVFKNNLTQTLIHTPNLQTIKKNISKYSPHPKKVTIIGITKTFTFSAIQSAEKHNIFNIGESRVQETEQKIENKKLLTAHNN